MKKVLVAGFYKQEAGFFGNIGDNLFREAFQYIFPDIEFLFTDQIADNNIDYSDNIFFGGGSFLDSAPQVDQIILEQLKKKNVFYVGIGAETNIHPIHQDLLKQAKLIICRSNIEKLKSININTIYYPDLVYSLSKLIVKYPKINNSILIIPNSYLINKYNDPTWKHLVWEWFKSEFAQYIDQEILNKSTVHFLSMCQSKSVCDEWAIIEILGKTQYGSKLNVIKDQHYNFQQLSSLISQYSLIISQRFHGLILADMVEVPCINITHHNKLDNFQSALTDQLSYYSFNKDVLNNKIQNLLEKEKNYFNSISIRKHSFEDLSKKIEIFLK